MGEWNLGTGNKNPLWNGRSLKCVYTCAWLQSHRVLVSRNELLNNIAWRSKRNDITRFKPPPCVYPKEIANVWCEQSFLTEDTGFFFYRLVPCVCVCGSVRFEGRGEYGFLERLYCSKSRNVIFLAFRCVRLYDFLQSSPVGLKVHFFLFIAKKYSCQYQMICGLFHQHYRERVNLSISHLNTRLKFTFMKSENLQTKFERMDGGSRYWYWIESDGRAELFWFAFGTRRQSRCW